MIMFKSKALRLLLALILLIASGCAKKVQTGGTATSPEAPKWQQIAVIPVVNKTAETPQIATMIRNHTIEEVYYKGYRKLPAEVMDEQLAGHYQRNMNPEAHVVGEVLGVDAVLYCTLSEWKKSSMLAYVSVTAKANFELRSARNGDVLWRSSKTIVRRSFHPLKKELQELTLLDYESAVVALVEGGLESLPKGPYFIAQGPLKKSEHEDWF